MKRIGFISVSHKSAGENRSEQFSKLEPGCQMSKERLGIRADKKKRAETDLLLIKGERRPVCVNKII